MEGIRTYLASICASDRKLLSKTAWLREKLAN